MTTPQAGPSRLRLPSPKQLARLWPRVRPHRKALALATVTLVLSAAIGLAFPMVVGYLLDSAFVQRDRSTLDRVALGLVGLFLIQAVLNYAQTYLLSATGERAVAGLRRELFAKLLEMPPGFFADRRTGELTSRLTTDIGLLQGVLSHQIAEFSRQILALVGGIAILTWMQPQLTLTALGVVPVVVGTAMFFGRRLRRISTGVQDKVADATAVAEEAFSQIRTVQSFVQEPAERTRYGEKVARVVEAALARAQVRGIFFGAITFSTFGGIVIVLWQGGRLVLEGSLTAGTLVSFLLYTATIAAAVGALASFFSSYQESVGAAERVFELLEAPSQVADPAEPVMLPRPVRGRVDLEQVSFRYHDVPGRPVGPARREHHARNRVKSSPSWGRRVAGRPRWSRLLSRFWDVTEGRIRLDGIDIRHLRLSDLQGRHRHRAPGAGALQRHRAREHRLRPTRGIAAEIERAARAAHAHEFVERLPKGYDTVVGERGIKLSGGQRQRIAIARAVLKDPAVLVLDEATSSLDTESERLVEDALEKLLVGRTTLIIAHRLSTVRRADRLLVLSHGRIIEQGTHAELLARGGLYARLYQRQFRDGDAELEAAAVES